MSLQGVKRRAQGWRATGERYDKQDLRSLSAPFSEFTNCIFVDCEMGLANLNMAKLTGAVFHGARLYGANFGGAALTDVSFVDCDIEQASFAGATLRGVSFNTTRAAYSNFSGATLKTVNFRGCNLHGADLDIIEGKFLAFTDSNLWGAKAAFGCAFWNATFDETAAKRFAAMLSRVYPSREGRAALEDIAGDQTRVVCRLMRSQEEEGGQG